LIVILTTGSHRYTHRVLARERRLDVKLLSYEEVFRLRRLPRATYVFTDMDRLGYFELEQAGLLYGQLRRAGLMTLNDPTRVSQRFKLLRQLKREGINDFDVWSLNDAAPPDRFPVFLRTASAHRGVLSGLLANQEALDQAIGAALEQGLPQRELLAVEYCAEPVAPGLFRKLSLYRVGERMITGTCVHDNQWVAKNGVKGIATEALYDDELRMVRDNPHGELLRRVFTLANIDYGRADFALVGGRPQIYEINTNPMLAPPQPHPVKARVESSTLAHENLIAAFAAIDSAGARGHIEVSLHPRVAAGLRRWPRRDIPWRP